MSQKKESGAELEPKKPSKEEPKFMTVRTHGKVFKDVPFEPLEDFLKKMYPEEYKK